VEAGPVPIDRPTGLEERTYKEGRAVVLERRLTTNGHDEIYRQVTHPWGEVMYFKDGLAVPARVWNEAFSGR
jgi:hypothetical protein